MSETKAPSEVEIHGNYDETQIGIILKAAQCMGQPIQILDLATGPNDFNPRLVERLILEGLDYRLVLTDISPRHLSIGYGNLEAALPKQEMEKIIPVIADCRDLRRNLDVVRIGGEMVSLDEAVREYPFLRRRLESPEDEASDMVHALTRGYFEDAAFDLVIGEIPYSSVGDSSLVANEVARLLKPGGYHIISEMQVEWVNPQAKRTPEALARANRKTIQEVRGELNRVLEQVPPIYSLIHFFENDEGMPEQAMQKGDIVKHAIMVYKKGR